MKLQIKDSNKIVDQGFGFWLIPRIRSKLISNISKYKFQNWDSYLTETEELVRLYKKKYTASEIIIFAANNLVCQGVAGDISIQLNATKLVPGFDRLPLNIATKLLNFGTLELKGCPIFTDTFNEFAESIDTYVGMYYMM